MCHTLKYCTTKTSVNLRAFSVWGGSFVLSLPVPAASPSISLRRRLASGTMFLTTPLVGTLPIGTGTRQGMSAIAMRIAAGVGTATIASAVLTSPAGIMMTGVPPTTIVEPWTVSGSPTALLGRPHVVSPRSRLGATVRAVRVLSQGRVVTAPRVLGVGNQIQYRLKQGILIYPTYSPS